MNLIVIAPEGQIIMTTCRCVYFRYNVAISAGTFSSDPIFFPNACCDISLKIVWPAFAAIEIAAVSVHDC